MAGMKSILCGLRPSFHFSGLNLLALVLFTLACTSGIGQTKVTVDFSKEVNILTTSSLGVPALMHDGNSFAPALVPYLKASGAVTMRYPGGHGTADLYHWETKSLSPYKGLAEAPYLAPESNFGSFAQLVDKLGSAVVVVNYGTNAKGTGGGEPAEAAAWVAYANGDAADASALGSDASGFDWKTVGFWARLRGAEVQATDDGYNFLRISHPKPLNIKLWQVGDQVYNNGYFGGEHTSNPDLHGPVPASPKDFSKLRKDPGLSPATFGARLNDFAKAMKAVDSSIQIGAVLTTPPEGEKSAPDFNQTVLKKACAALDFATLEWTPTALLAPDYKTLDEPGMFSASRDQLGEIVRTMISDYKLGCPKDHRLRLAFAPAAIPSWAKVEHPAFTALWVAEVYSTLIEAGSANVGWSEIYGDSFLSADRKKQGPAFASLQMVHIIAHSPGDVFVSSTSSNPKVSVHATKRRDGYVGIMLVNEDPSAPVTVKLSLSGVQVAGKGKRFDYGKQQAAGAALASVDLELGADMTVVVPPYTVTDLVMPIGK
jgi:hypothetical protein